MTPNSAEVDSDRSAIKVLLADDHTLFRRGLKTVLSIEPGIEIVGEVGDGAEAAKLAEQLTPDVVLMDVRMPRRVGIEACSAIAQAVPDTRIVMLTVSDDEADLFDAVRAGACGYLLKEVPGEDIADGIRAVMHGQSLISPSMASALLTEFANLSRNEHTAPTSVAVPRLIERELEVLKLVAHGLGNRDIATELFISEHSVQDHVRNILDKLQLHSQLAAEVHAVQRSVLDPDDTGG